MSRIAPLRLSLILALALPAIAAQAQINQPKKAKPANGQLSLPTVPQTAPVTLPKASATTTVPAPAAAPAPDAAAEAASQEITVTGKNGQTVVALPGKPEFIAPMGEPFRSKDKLSGAEHWFEQADADGDNRVTLEEFKADAFKFFATLDVDKSDDIDPKEIEHYEEYVAPEVKVTNSWGDPNKGKMDNDGNYTPPPYPERIGAGRIAWLAIPEPIIYADTNFDRGVDKREFNAAAEKRFKMLDRNGDGALTRGELPKPGG